MKVYVCILVAMLAMAAPAQALLGAKLALLGVLRNSIGGGSNAGGYGNGGYANGGYGNAGYGHGINYNRPVYTGHNTNYGWGQQSYGGGYASDYSGGGTERFIKIIKVIVPREQPQAYYDNYGTSSSAGSSSSASWTPIPASGSAPVLETYATQPVQTVQLGAPAPVPVQGSIQVPVSGPLPAPVQVIQPPPRSFYVQPQPQYVQRSKPIYHQVTVQRPIYQQPQGIPVPAPQPLPQGQETVRTIKIIVDGESQQHAPAQTYGPPPPAPTYVTPSVSQNGAWNSGSWSSDSSANGWNNVGTGPWKSGSIWENVGC